MNNAIILPPPDAKSKYLGDELVHILWTGGLDSTARIVELSRYPITIQPYYIIDPGRASMEYEKKAMKSIRERLINDTNTKAIFLTVKEIKLDDIHPDLEITDAWRELSGKYHIGSQYDFLARYAKQHKITFELGVERGDMKTQTCIKEESRMLSCQDAVGTNHIIDEKISSKNVWTVFRYFKFPLWDKYKQDEVDMMESLNCGDIVNMTWFCHSPLLGKPCGHCNPCKDARHYGFSWRLSKSRYILWYILFFPQKIFKSIFKKI